MCKYMVSHANVTLSSVPEVPQEVALAEQVVTSVFVTWREPPGQVEGYKVGPVTPNIPAPIIEAQTSI